ncbi:hypothetical protein STANM309S_01197 [Streptomyces tanashiensis]
MVLVVVAGGHVVGVPLGGGPQMALGAERFATGLLTLGVGEGDDVLHVPRALPRRRRRPVRGGPRRWPWPSDHSASSPRARASVARSTTAAAACAAVASSPYARRRYGSSPDPAGGETSAGDWASRAVGGGRARLSGAADVACLGERPFGDAETDLDEQQPQGERCEGGERRDGVLVLGEGPDYVPGLHRDVVEGDGPGPGQALTDPVL